jgi:hypothetical protein
LQSLSPHGPRTRSQNPRNAPRPLARTRDTLRLELRAALGGNTPRQAQTRTLSQSTVPLLLLSRNNRSQPPHPSPSPLWLSAIVKKGPWAPSGQQPSAFALFSRHQTPLSCNPPNHPAQHGTTRRKKQHNARARTPLHDTIHHTSRTTQNTRTRKTHDTKHTKTHHPHNTCTAHHKTPRQNTHQNTTQHTTRARHTHNTHTHSHSLTKNKRHTHNKHTTTHAHSSTQHTTRPHRPFSRSPPSTGLLTTCSVNSPRRSFKPRTSRRCASPLRNPTLSWPCPVLLFVSCSSSFPPSSSPHPPHLIIIHLGLISITAQSTLLRGVVRIERKKAQVCAHTTHAHTTARTQTHARAQHT